jgi:hypothetical protein
VIGWLARKWRATQRSTDMTTLWPACRDCADDLENARLAFFMHATNDTAWTSDYTDEQIWAIAEELT